MDKLEFAVRLTRLSENSRSQYEDRGHVDSHGVINGCSGFGGRLNRRLLQNNGVFLEGKGGTADFIIVATQTGPKHYRCFRRFEVKHPTKLWGTQVAPGTYFATTEDQLLRSADKPPGEIKFGRLIPAQTEPGLTGAARASAKRVRTSGD